jgi:ribonuclease-3 family protein
MENYFKMNFTAAQVNAMTNLALAHMGDGVYELLVRGMLCTRGDKTVQKLHRDTVELVKAPTQARFADKLLPHLTEEEAAYYRRGKNSHTHAAPKSASPKEYAKATGLEALFGALYLLGRTDRLTELFAIMMDEN